MKIVIKAVLAVVVFSGIAGAMDINGDLGAYLQDAGKVKVAAPEAVRASVVWTAQEKELPGNVFRAVWTSPDAPEVILIIKEPPTGKRSFTAAVDGKKVVFSDTGMAAGADKLAPADASGLKMKGVVNGEPVAISLEIKAEHSIPDVFASVKAKIKSPSGEAVLDMTKGWTLTGSLSQTNKKAGAYCIAWMEASIVAASIHEDELDEARR